MRCLAPTSQIGPSKPGTTDKSICFQFRLESADGVSSEPSTYLQSQKLLPKCHSLLDLVLKILYPVLHPCSTVLLAPYLLAFPRPSATPNQHLIYFNRSIDNDGHARPARRLRRNSSEHFILQQFQNRVLRYTRPI